MVGNCRQYAYNELPKFWLDRVCFVYSCPLAMRFDMALIYFNSDLPNSVDLGEKISRGIVYYLQPIAYGIWSLVSDFRSSVGNLGFWANSMNGEIH